MKQKLIFQLLILFFPWPLRRRLLVGLCGFTIHPSARLGRSIILAKSLVMEERSEIGALTLCKAIDRLHLKAGAFLGAANLITGFASDHSEYYKKSGDRHCELVLEEKASVTSRHYLDCNGGLYIGAFSTVAGLHTQILTHSVDIYTNTMGAYPVRIGAYCFIGTGCILLPGSSLPDYCVLGAGAVLNKSCVQDHTLYAGSPARVVKELTQEKVLYFSRKERCVT